MDPPTLFLPPIRSIGHNTCSIDDLKAALQYLTRLYTPQVRGSRRIRQNRQPSVATDWSALRTDTFESSYSIRWLTRLVSHGTEHWNEDVERSAILEDAARLLAVFSGTAAAGIIHRTFVFDKAVGDPVIVRLKDVPLENQDFGSVGCQTWGGAYVLAEMLVAAPQDFGFGPLTRKLRVLELGAGTGLLSIAAGKLCASQDQGRTEIVATDFYPSVLENLQENIASNPSHSENIALSSSFLDWSLFPHTTNPPAPLDQPFDVVLGADIVYDAQHALWIKSSLSTLLRKPTYGEMTLLPTFHLVIPLRATFSKESSTIESVFKLDNEGMSQPSQLIITAKETIICEADDSTTNDEVVEYVYYKIGWSS